MKKLVFLMLLATNCFAGTNLVLEGANKFNTERYHQYVGAAGIANYYDVNKSFAYSSYLGAGLQDEKTFLDEREYWTAAKADVIYKLGKSTKVHFGGTAKYLTEDARFNNDIHVVVSYKLFD